MASNADGDPLTVTDARGATQTFTYNSRHMSTGVSYSWPLTPVSITYDGAGNRTLMTDGTGSWSYQYNQLSQLTSETRQFAGLTGNFTLSYEYNLAGALKAFTDHASSRVDYAFNSGGMLTAVTGSGAHSTPTYLSNIAYRAWGAIKDMDFGNGAHQHLNFNSRLRNTSMTLSNGSINATWNFDYYADGKIQKVTDTQNPIFDRAFDYDHIGRLQEVRTGSEARGGSTPDGPFKQTYTYDVWENTTARSYRLWSGSMQSDSTTFTNNKRQYWFYDAEGNLGADFDANYGYDAAGRQNHFSANVYVGGWPTPHPQQSVMEITQTFDGNSTPVKKTTINRSEYYVGEDVQIQEETTHVYYLRSSVLGKIIAELDHTGYKRLGYVFAGGMQIATQSVWNPGYGYDVALTTTSPATGSEYMADGGYLTRKELDPFGADVTEPPAPMLISEPVFYNPKFADMPIEIEGRPSDEYEQANADWASLVTATIQAAQQRDRAERLWQSGRRSEAMAILQRNPNVGIEYRALVDGEVVRSGSYFGKDAADFLNGLNMALEAGLIMGVTEEGSVKRQHAEWKTPRELYGSNMDRSRAYNFMRGYNVALKVLDNADCLREVSMLGGDLNYGAKRTLSMIFVNGGFRFDPTLTSLARVQGRGAAARILLSESFMQGNLLSANRDLEHLLYGETLALAILHELVHALGGRQHGDFGTPEGKKEHDRWNDVIYDYCFKKP